MGIYRYENKSIRNFRNYINSNVADFFLAQRIIDSYIYWKLNQPVTFSFKITVIL